ncbi:hypothetical protein J6A31_03690 [bacterium]|nr:hypothetical protein [bacterium]
MFLFIATIFIAELIIVSTLISYIMKVDKVVKRLHKDVVALKPQLETALVGVRSGIHQVKEKKDSIFDVINKKRNKYIAGAIVSGALYLTIFVFKHKSRRIAQVCQGLLVAKEIWDSVSA